MDSDITISVIRQAADLSAATHTDDIPALSPFFAQGSGHHETTRRIIFVVKHRALRRIRQALRVATACSTRARIFVWDRLTACRPAEGVSHRPG